MAVNATRTITIAFTGDISGSNAPSANPNASSPGSITIHTLAPGDNTITVPTGGSTVKGATLIPPSGNANAITLKGVGGDTGIAISKVDPTSIGFETAPANFVLNAASTIAGMRIIWS